MAFLGEGKLDPSGISGDALFPLGIPPAIQVQMSLIMVMIKWDLGYTCLVRLGNPIPPPKKLRIPRSNPLWEIYLLAAHYSPPDQSQPLLNRVILPSSKA